MEQKDLISAAPFPGFSRLKPGLAQCLSALHCLPYFIQVDNKLPVCPASTRLLVRAFIFYRVFHNECVDSKALYIVSQSDNITPRRMEGIDRTCLEYKNHLPLCTITHYPPISIWNIVRAWDSSTFSLRVIHSRRPVRNVTMVTVCNVMHLISTPGSYQWTLPMLYLFLRILGGLWRIIYHLRMGRWIVGRTHTRNMLFN